MKKLLLLLVLLLTWGGVSLHAETWKKVTSTDDITLDGTYIIVCESKNVAMTYNYYDASAKSKRLGQTAVSISSNTISNISDEVAVISLEGTALTGSKLKLNDKAGNSIGYYKLSGIGNMQIVSTVDDATAISSFTINSGNAVLTMTHTDNKDYTLRHHSTSAWFASYTSAQTAVQLYKKEATEPVDYTFPYDKQTVDMDLSAEKTLSIADAHPTIEYTWAATDEANNENFEVTEENNVITLTALAADTYTVTAKWKADDTWTAGTATFTVNVNKLKYTPTFDAEINTVKGDEVTLNVGESHPDFTYTFSPEGIVTINNKNVLTAVAQGSTTVKATWGDDEWEAGEATFTVNVNDKRVFDYTFTDLSLYVLEDYTFDFGTTAPAVTFTCETPDVITFDEETPSFIASSKGSTKVTATWGDDTWNSGSADFTVTVDQRTYEPKFPESLELTVGQNGEFEVAEKPAVTFAVTEGDAEGFLMVGHLYEAKAVGNYTIKATWGSEDLTEEYAYGEATIAVTIKAAPEAELPVVKNGNEEISRDTWGYELAATTQFAVSSTNAAAIRVWKNDELYTNAEGNDWAVEDGAASVTIEAPALNELVKYVFAGVNTAGEVGQDQFVMTVKLPAATTSDELTVTNLGVTTNYNDYVYTATNSTNIVYDAFAYNSGGIQLNSKKSSAIFVKENPNGFILKSITVTAKTTASSATLTIYGRDEAYTSKEDVNNSTSSDQLGAFSIKSSVSTATINLEKDVKFVGLKPSANIIVTSVKFEWGYPTPNQPIADKTVTSLSEGESITWTVEAPCTIKVTKLDGYYGQSAPMRAANAAPDDNWTMSEDGLSATYTAPANAEKASYRIVAVNAAGEESKPFMFDVNDNGGVSGIDAVEANDTEAVEYYNLQGVRVEADNLTPGLYITRKGNTISKVVVR